MISTKNNIAFEVQDPKGPQEPVEWQSKDDKVVIAQPNVEIKDGAAASDPSPPVPPSADVPSTVTFNGSILNQPMPSNRVDLDKRRPLPFIPNPIQNIFDGSYYTRIKILGRGAFATCHEVVHNQSTTSYAMKIFSKRTNYRRFNIHREIELHELLEHVNIVKLYDSFADAHNTYVLLELCSNNSLREHQRSYGVSSEFECRYFMSQLISGVQYLHENQIIHRDLKLGNVFLTEKFHVKIGDFGLSTRLMYANELRKPLCGTPNYTAPEMLRRTGYSLEIDIWSSGCIMYNLLVGRPPFDSNTMSETYELIAKCEYAMPLNVSEAVKKMIADMLQLNPKTRATAKQLLTYDFLVKGEPLPDHMSKSDFIEKKEEPVRITPGPISFLKENLDDDIQDPEQPCPYQQEYADQIASSQRQIKSLIGAQPALYLTEPENKFFENDAVAPRHWVTHWADNSDQYGFGYRTSDGSIGVLFNDNTKMIIYPNQIDVGFNDYSDKNVTMTINQYPALLNDKLRHLMEVHKYFSSKLNAGELLEEAKYRNDSPENVPHLYYWFRTTRMAVLYLSNGTIQLSFYDQTKLIIMPKTFSFTYVTRDDVFHNYRFARLVEIGWSKELYQKMVYADAKLTIMKERIFMDPSPHDNRPAAMGEESKKLDDASITSDDGPLNFKALIVVGEI